MSKTPKTLLVEDEPAIRLAVSDALTEAGHAVDVATEGHGALTLALGQPYDLIILDLMLPGLDGMEICRRLRAAGKRTPLLMLTARGGEEDRVGGLGAGADDYVTKPFSVRELLARVQALLRRAAWDEDGPELCLAAGGVLVDLDRLTARSQGGGPETALTPREGAILRYLAGRQGKVASKRDLLTDVWGYPDVQLETRTVENTIGVLRRKLQALGTDPDGEGASFCVTVRGAGFKLAPEVEVRCGS